MSFKFAGRLLGGVCVGSAASAMYIHCQYVAFEDVVNDAKRHIECDPPNIKKHSRTLGGYPVTYYTEGTLREAAPAPQPLSEHLANVVDVCVVGGGFAGLHCALALTEKGKSVAVLEARRVGCRASGRNGGDAIIGFHTETDELAKLCGEPMAKEIYSHSIMGYDRLKSIIQKYRVQCGHKEEGALTVSFTHRVEKSKRDINAILEEERQGVLDSKTRFNEELEVWDKAKLEEVGLHSDRFAYGVYNPKNLTLNPLELVLGLARACRQQKAQVFESSPVTSITKLPRRHHSHHHHAAAASSTAAATPAAAAPVVQHEETDTWLITTEMGSIMAKNVVLATNGAPTHLNPRLSFATSSLVTAMMLTKPIDVTELNKVLSAKCAVFDERFALAYFRRVEGNRILFGSLAKGMPMNRKWAEKALIADLTKTFPSLAGLVEADVSWQGRLEAKVPVFPMIGRDTSGMWYSLGYSGHGLVPTCAGGELLASAITSLDPQADGSRGKPDERYKLWGNVNYGPAAHHVPGFLPPSFIPLGGPWGYIGSVLFCKYAEIKDAMEHKK